MSFDVKKMECPGKESVDLKMTKRNFEIFMTSYGYARERVGKSRMPKLTQTLTSIPATTNKEYSGDAERFLIERETYMPEYKELHQIFGQGYLAISNPLKEGGTERRRQLFMLKFIYGLTIQAIAERMFIGKSTVVDESRQGLIQFCHAVGLLIEKSEVGGHDKV